MNIASMKYLIAGLGNMGDEYANTRHNIGFIAADAFVLDMGGAFKTERYAEATSVTLKGRNITVIKPNTYMNLSGKAVKYWLTKTKVPVENLLVILDDINLPLGALRVRQKGGHGGHNGLIDIIEHLETSDFARLRIGIGNDFAQGYQVDYVLGKWSKMEEEIMKPRVVKAVEIIKSFILQGTERTMNLYNTR